MESVVYDYFIFLALLIPFSIYWAKIGFPGKYGALGVKRLLEWTEVWLIFPKLLSFDITIALASLCVSNPLGIPLPRVAGLGGASLNPCRNSYNLR